MNYIQYMKPGGTAENKKETSKFIEWLNKAGKSWKDFWDQSVTVQYAYNPHAVVGNGGAPFSTTLRRGDFATLTAAAVAIPATAAGVATVGVVPTLVGMGVGIGAGAAGSAGGSKLVELADGDENAQEMVGDIAGFTLGAIAGGKATKATTNYLNFWNSHMSPKSIYTAMAEGMTPTTNQTYGLVKYYGPTMGKTTAAKTNANLVDFDDVVRGPIAELAAKKGVTPRELKIANDPDYVSLLEAEVARWRMNPANAGKTLVISNKALSSSTAGYNNLPSIPDKETFITRQILRGGGTREEAAAYYDALIENNPNLKIDNRFVSDIESGTRAAKISEAERLGIPKGERNLLYKKGYRKLYPQDVLINLEKEKRQIRNLFKSKIYQDRLLADGYTLSEIDDFINKYIFMDKFIKAPAVLDKLMFELGLAFHDYVKVRLPKNFETALHEYGHLSEYPSMWTDIKLPKITEAIFPYNSRYYLEPGEIRTRALGVLLWLNENGKTIDDFYNLKDPYTALGENRRAFLFLSAYPEDQGRNYLMHFRKQGGKLNYLNLMK